MQIGEVMRAGGVGEVLESRHPGFKKGDHVHGTVGIQEYATVDGKGLTKVDTRLAPLPVYLGTLGMPGMTAYFGLLDVGKPHRARPSSSRAAGAVGMVVGQIAKIKGCRAVGIAGGREKCDYLVRDRLRRRNRLQVGRREAHAAPALSAGRRRVLRQRRRRDSRHRATQIARNARIVICGAISQYNSTTGVRGPANYMSLLVNRASMTGMLGSTTRTAIPKRCARWQAGSRRQAQDTRGHRRGLETFPRRC